MATETLALPKTVLAWPGAARTIPSWMKPLEPELTKPEDLETLDRLPELTVVWFQGLQPLLERRTFLSHLSSRLSRSERPARVVFVFESKAGRKRGTAIAESYLSLLELFDRPSDLEIADGKEAAEGTVWEAVAKIAASRASSGASRGPRDPMAEVKEVLAATKGLRTRLGKLSADKVAAAFGLSVAELSELLGKSRQSVSKTPDSEALQPLLRAYERIARLRALLDDEDFRSWLRLPNRQLEGRTPLEVIRGGKAARIADLAEDLLTGQPA